MCPSDWACRSACWVHAQSQDVSQSSDAAWHMGPHLNHVASVSDGLWAAWLASNGLLGWCPMGCLAGVQWARGRVQDADTSFGVWDGHGNVSWDWEGLSLCPDDGCMALGTTLNMQQLGLCIGDTLST